MLWSAVECCAGSARFVERCAGLWSVVEGWQRGVELVMVPKSCGPPTPPPPPPPLDPQQAPSCRRVGHPIQQRPRNSFGDRLAVNRQRLALTVYVVGYPPTAPSGGGHPPLVGSFFPPSTPHIPPPLVKQLPVGLFMWMTYLLSLEVCGRTPCPRVYVARELPAALPMPKHQRLGPQHVQILLTLLELLAPLTWVLKLDLVLVPSS